MRLLVLAFPLLWAFQEGPVELRWDLRKGARFRYRIQLHVKTQSLNYSLDDTLAFTVTDVDEKGQALLRARYDEVGMKASGLQEYSFDSRKDKEVPKEQNARLFSGLVGRSFSLRMAPNGRIAEVSGLDAVMDEMTRGAGSEEERAVARQTLNMFLSNEILKTRLQQVFPFLPEKKVGPGDRWTAETTARLPLLGSVQAGTENSLAGLEGGEARLAQEIRIDKPPADGANPMEGFLVIKPSKGRGEAVFSVPRGRLLSYRGEAALEFVLGEQTWEAKFTSSLKLEED